MPIYRVTLHATVIEEEVYEIEADSPEEIRASFGNDRATAERFSDPTQPLELVEVSNREVYEIEEVR